MTPFDEREYAARPSQEAFDEVSGRDELGLPRAGL
jgi:hypothetical protein